MDDPLSQVIQLLRPRAVFSKAIGGAGDWAVRYGAFGQPGFCAMLQGSCRLAVEGEPPCDLQAGDFVLLPATPAFTMSGGHPVRPVEIDPRLSPAPQGEVRYGRRDGPADMRQFGGYFAFASPDAALLVALLPRLIHIRGVDRLTRLVALVGDEAEREEPGRELILGRLVEVLLIEALRAVPRDAAPRGLLRGLADGRIAQALHRMHAAADEGLTVAGLAREAGMSRSAFFDRFSRSVGMPPMEYLLAWRMALAKDLLRSGKPALDDVARRVGYGSAAAFSTAFSRHVGQPPGRFMRAAPATAA